MPEYRVLKDKTQTAEKDDQDAAAHAENLEHEQKLELKPKEKQLLLQAERPDEYSKDTSSKSSGRRAVLTLAQARENDQPTQLTKEMLDLIDRNIDVEPWQAVIKASTIKALVDVREPEKGPDVKAEKGIAELEHNEVARPELRTDGDSESRIASVDLRPEPDRGSKTLVSVEQELDQDVVDTVALYIRLEPKDAIEKSLPEPEQRTADLGNHAKDNDVVADQKLKDKRLLLESYTHQEPLEPKHEEPEIQRFSCPMPVDIANTVLDFSPLEPETVEFLHEKYDYVSKNTHSDKSFDKNKSSAQAAEHARDELMPERESICPERFERAQLQIEILQDIDSKLCHSPRFQHFVELELQSDPKTATFEINEVQQLQWHKAEIPPPLASVTEEKPDGIEKTEITLPSAHQRLCASLQSQEVIACFHRDLQQKEKDLERLDDEEPPPSQFCTIRISESYCFILRLWEARTLEEFDYYDPSIPATPEAIREIVAKDKEYKLWLSRNEHAKTRLDDHLLSRVDERLDDIEFDR